MQLFAQSEGGAILRAVEACCLHGTKVIHKSFTRLDAEEIGQSFYQSMVWDSFAPPEQQLMSDLFCRSEIMKAFNSSFSFFSSWAEMPGSVSFLVLKMPL